MSESNLTAREIIESTLDTETVAGLGVLSVVAANISEHHGVEPALTYLLGAMDCAGASGQRNLASIIKSCRDKLKENFR